MNFGIDSNAVTPMLAIDYLSRSLFPLDPLLGPRGERAYRILFLKRCG